MERAIATVVTKVEVFKSHVQQCGDGIELVVHRREKQRRATINVQR